MMYPQIKRNKAFHAWDDGDGSLLSLKPSRPRSYAAMQPRSHAAKLKLADQRDKTEVEYRDSMISTMRENVNASSNLIRIQINYRVLDY